MEFPISGVTINPLLLIGLGFVVGILGGFFGVGGGFLAGPFMFSMGVPGNFVVGTDLAHITGNSLISFRRHRALGNVDLKLGGIMVMGTAVGVEIGARVIEGFEARQSVDEFIGGLYIVILLLVGTFTMYESIRTLRSLKNKDAQLRDVSGFPKFTKAVRRINIPPMISFPNSGIKSISIWVVLGVGFVAGLLTGMLGVGGGFIRMPMFIYILGVPTHVAVGTDLFEIIFSAGYGTITHAIKGNVDIIMALVMQTGAAVGAQIGSVSTQYFRGPMIRLAFSFLPFIGAGLVIAKLLNEG